jgi:hypothetical protein
MPVERSESTYGSMLSVVSICAPSSSQVSASCHEQPDGPSSLPGEDGRRQTLARNALVRITCGGSSLGTVTFAEPFGLVDPALS